ncbi:Serine hydrolase FSH [Ostreococcus tauri]|uniref:Serine hydrolase FSH n=1 Tax=Ostreococcus tauri TaxID=70448 RepID=Q00XC3_OSTTA|nr:Serine hydrolase FSH [Ostreococcus tauri]CAL56388.1 Serine hydrolase FSH [Ostreococcus tauri]|eukprot:XP_003082531.1 Serine hydrolase FSH [Ostreococcus tauri]
MRALTTASSVDRPPRRLKILALHGFRANASVFERQTTLARWDLDLRDIAELYFLDAPNAASGAIPRDLDAFFGPGVDGREWWSAETTERGTMSYEGLTRSLAEMERRCAEDGPFDGVLGFSQGGTMAAIALASEGLRERFKFGVIVSGMKSRGEETKGLSYGDVSAPTLHVIGEADRVVPKGLSVGLFDAMSGSVKTMATHAGGHVVPRANERGEPILRAFLEERLREVQGS